MGCSSSRDARGGVGGVVPPSAAPPERRQGLRSRSLGICRGGQDSVHAYTALSFEEPPAVMDAAAEEEKPQAAVMVASLKDAASSSSWTARWSAEPAAAASSLSPEPLPALDLDPAVLPGLRQLAVQVPSPSHPALLYPEKENPAPTEEACDDGVDMGSPAVRDIPEVTAFVHARVVDEFHEEPETKKKAAAVSAEEAAPDVVVVDGNDDVIPPVTVPRRRLPPRAGKPVVLYVTSLRSVRRTFEDCRAVRAILRCYHVRVDERDVSMHAAFRSELRGLLGGGVFEGRALPRVFVDDGRQRYDLGGAEELRALHEAGELARVLAGCEAAAVPTTAAGRAAAACAACGEVRFLPCETCHGSCKVFVDDEGCRRLAGFFSQCPDCNENGLIRCPVCCY